MGKDNEKNMVLDVVFLLDITGSMSNEIAAMKGMIAEFTSTSGDSETLRIHVWPFTESSNECYVSKSPAGCTRDELVRYVNGIKLCSPPDHPRIKNANGADGPENVLAATSALLDSFTEKDNILCFIITDNIPHHKANGPSTSAEAEIRWLEAQDPTLPTDMFQRLDSVIERLNVTFVPILSSYSSLCSWYAQAAVLTDGLCLRPATRDSKNLSEGLVTLMNAMRSTIINRQANLSELESAIGVCADVFFVLSVNSDTFEPFNEDPETVAELSRVFRFTHSRSEISASLFGLLQTTLDRFMGKRSGKRCRSVQPGLVAASVRVFILAMLVKTGLAKDEHIKVLNEAQARLHEELKANAETGEREIFFLDRLLSNIQSGNAPIAPSDNEVQCMVTLQSAWETLSDLEQIPSTVEDVKAWMDIVLQLTICRLLEVNFPKDANGNPDFMDAWSSSIRRFSWGTTLSALAAIGLRAKSEDETYLDPTSREKFNGALLLAHPNDPVLSACYTTLSALPSLQGLVQGYLISGGLKIFPSLTPGLQASAVLAITRKIAGRDGCVKPVEQEWMRSLVWSIAIADVVPASDVVKSLETDEGALNPSDNVAKLTAGFIGYRKKAPDLAALKKRWLYLFEELSADSVAYAIKYDHMEDIVSDEAAVGAFIKELEGFNPVESVHPAERFSADKALADDTSLRNLQMKVANCAAYKKTSTIIKLLWSFIQDAEFPLGEDVLVYAFTESLLLRKRTGRYTLSADWTWVRKETVSLAEHLAALVRGHYSNAMGKWKLKRKRYACSMLFKEFLEAVKASSKCTESECEALLAKLHYRLHKRKYVFVRINVPSLLERLPSSALPNFGAALIRGGWTTDPPSQLRRHAATISSLFDPYPDLQAELLQVINAREVCNRANPNRHGHTVDNQYPGFTGWSAEYAEKRLATKRGEKRARGILKEMEEYSKFLSDIGESVAALNSEGVRQLVEIIINLACDKVSAAVCKNAINALITWDRDTIGDKERQEGDVAAQKIAEEVAKGRRNIARIRKVPEKFAISSIPKTEEKGKHKKRSSLCSLGLCFK